MNASNGKLIVVTVAAGLIATLLIVPGSSTNRLRVAEEHEVRRIQAHFDSVLAELVPLDVTGLSRQQRMRRARLFATLAAYRDRGLFPHNYDVPDRMVPSFVDEQTGTRCAVGQLLASTGRDDIVRRVAQENRHVYAATLGADTAFAAWLDSNGLTLAEASRIQPSYGGPVRIVKPVDDRWTNIDLAAAAGSLLLTGWNVAGNLDGHAMPMNALGIATGVAALGLGGYSDNSRIVRHTVANLAMVTGGVSIVVGSLGVVHHARTGNPPASRRISVGPWFVPTMRAASQQVGVTGRIRF